MDRHRSIEKAEKAIIKNFGVILPVLILATVIHAIQMWLSISFFNETSTLDRLIFNFAVFPILYIGITNFAVKLINDEKTDIGNIFEIVCKRPIQSYILSFCYIAITSIGSILAQNISGIDSNLLGVIGFIFNGFMTVKFVLAIYIFVSGHEKTAIESLEIAWNESKGFSLELMKIYLTVAMMSFILTMAGGLITSLIAGLLGFVGVNSGGGLVFAVGSICIGIMVIFENLTFAYLATDIFSGSIESERFFDGVDKKSMQALMVKVSIFLGVVAIGWVIASGDSNYIKSVKMEESQMIDYTQGLYDMNKYEYKVGKDVKLIGLAIMSLDEDKRWKTIEYMEEPIKEGEQKGQFTINFNSEDGSYKFDLNTNGNNYQKNGTNEQLKFDARNYVVSSFARQREIETKRLIFLGRSYKGEKQDIKDHEIDALTELEDIRCTVVYFE